MQWFVNDSSLQGQFENHDAFCAILRNLLSLRHRNPGVKDNLRVTRTLPQASVAPGANVRDLVTATRDKDLTSAVMNWLDRSGPFIDDARAQEEDDYFEYQNLDVTDSGLGEAARRTKMGEDCATFSFVGGPVDFAIDPLMTDHGLAEARLGQYKVHNRWDLATLEADVAVSSPPVTNWEQLVATARECFPYLDISDLHLERKLAREPFESSISDRALVLLAWLDSYVADRRQDGSIGPLGQEIVEQHFTGDRAVFSNESATNIAHFKREMTFSALDGRSIFAPWHGKISHRVFRIHFEWPLRVDRERLAILYLGPKVTKS